MNHNYIVIVVFALENCRFKRLVLPTFQLIANDTRHFRQVVMYMACSVHRGHVTAL